MESSPDDFPKTLTILQALKKLIDPSNDSVESSSGLLERLSSNLVDTRHHLAHHGLDKQVLAVKDEHNLKQHTSNCPLDNHWEFVSEALSLLILFCGSSPFSQINKHESLKDRTTSELSPELLSVKDEQTVKNVLQFISLFGIYPYLSPGVGLSLKARTKSELKLEKSQLPSDVRNWCLRQCVNSLLHCTQHRLLSSLIKSSILDYDVLTSLIQMVFSKDDKQFVSSDDRAIYEKQLSQFVDNRHPPSVVKTLLVLQGPPAKSLPKGHAQSPVWFRHACGHLLSGLLMKRNGLVAVIRGIFEDSEGGIAMNARPKVVWLKCEAVAKVVSCCPSQMQSVSNYYALICPQVLDLLVTDDRLFIKVACCILSTMFLSHKEEALQCFGIPLFGPLLQLTRQDSKLSLPLSELFSCLKMLNTIISVSEPGSQFFLVLAEFLLILFETWRAIYKQQQEPAISDVLKGIVINCLKSIELADQIHFFCHFFCIPLPETPVLIFKQIPVMSTVVFRDRQLVFEEQRMIQTAYSEQVEELGEALVEILLDSTKSSKNKLFGCLFMKCVDHLVSLLQNDSGHSVEESTVIKRSNVLLKLEGERHSLSSALVLYLVAGVCEKMGEKILTDVDEITLFSSLSTIVKFHADCSAKRHEMIIIKENDYTMDVVGGHITLSIALGLMSVFMSANKEIPMNMRPLLSSVLPALESVSKNHESSELATLAGELRVCIATLGAVWSRETETNNSKTRRDQQTHEKVENTLGIEVITSHTATKDKANGQTKLVPTSLENIFSNLNDPLIPVQGHGLIELARLIEAKEQSVIDNLDLIIATLNEYLQRNDSYVYMAAMRGIVAVVSIDASKIVAMLCEHYTGGVSHNIRTTLKENNNNNKGLYTCSGNSNDAPILKDQTTVEWVMKVGEVLVKVIKCLGDSLPFYADHLLSTFLINSQHSDPLVRASALSNLAELCGRMQFIFTKVENEITSVLSSILQFDSCSTVKQAAIVVIKNIFKKFDENSCTQDLQDYMLQFYRLLKRVESSDSDPLTRAHAGAALGELDTRMKHMLFPVHTMTKKISVLQ